MKERKIHITSLHPSVSTPTSLSFSSMIFSRSPTTLVLCGRGREARLTDGGGGEWTAASPPFPQERTCSHLSRSLFAWICSLYSYFELNISNKKGCGLTCLIFPSLSCVIPPWPFSPSVVTPLPGFLLSVTLSQVCPEVHVGGGIFLALVSLSRSHPPHMLWLWISELAYHGREILLVVPLRLTISLSLA